MRYLAFVGVFAIYLYQYWNRFIMQLHDTGHGFSTIEGEMISSLFLQFPKYLWLVILRFWPDAPDQILKIGKIGEIVLFTLCCVCVLLGVREIWRKNKTVSIIWVFMQFFILWNGLAFFQTMLAQGGFGNSWRFYFNAVGFSIVVAYGIIYIIEYVSSSVRLLPKNSMLAMVAIGVALIMLMVNADIRNRFIQLRDLPAMIFKLQRQFSWPNNIECDEVKRLTLMEVEQILQTTRNLRCKNLKKIDLSTLDMNKADLSLSNLSMINLSRVNLRKAILNKACLISADLTKADLREASLQESYLSGSDLTGADLTKANLSGSNLMGAILKGANFEGTNLSGADLKRANFEGADLNGAILKGANFEGADLSGAILKGADFEGADLNGAILKGADFEGADLNGAILKGADFEGADLSGAD
ncbi:pentapeptide repeat-containing protein [Thermodesulfobacteriota bacterium]